jgi:hypothetical protein
VKQLAKRLKGSDKLFMLRQNKQMAGKRKDRKTGVNIHYGLYGIAGQFVSIGSCVDLKLVWREGR